VDIPFPAERQAVRRVLHGAGHPHTYTFTRVLAEQGLNLSSLDARVRKRSVQVMAGRLEDAVECGASSVTVISGPRPQASDQRADALKGLEEALGELSGAAGAAGLSLVIEPLDCEAHKRNTLGTTPEAVAMCDRLRAAGRPVQLCVDTAHLLLNSEDIPGAVTAARPHLLEFHFCNAVTDPSHPLFGDRHLPFGAPGRVGLPEVARWMRELAAMGFLSHETRPRVFCEVMASEVIGALEVVAHCEQSLREAWSLALGDAPA
jgi:sugar phosphate isomerase/epimerase